ncbi:MAG: CHASE2 domain-containing protein, partial [Myxococcota bacterium]
MNKLLQWFTQVTPLRLSLGIALIFVVAHLVIEAGTFEFGVLSRKGYLRTLDLKLLDTKFSQASRVDLPEPKVVVAAIDEESIERFGRFPWSRNILADFIDRVAAEQPSAIAFDVVFSDPDKNSSYVSVKRFLDAYDASELGPESKAFETLAAQVTEAEAAFNKAEAKAATLRARLKKEPGKAQYLKLLADTSLEAERAQRKLTTAKTALKTLEGEREKFRNMLKGEISAVSPDDRFAESIKSAGNVILGYFAFETEEALASIPPEKAEQDRAALEPSAIGGLYEAYIEDFDGATVERFIAHDVDWPKLQIKEAMGFQSPLPVLATQTSRFGFFNSVIDSDNQMRRLRLLYKSRDKLYPALSVQAAALYFDAGIFPEDGGINPGVTVDGVNLGTELLVTTDPQSKMLVNYYEDPQEYFPVCGIAALLDGRCEALGDDLSKLKDKVILVGATAIGTFDVRPIAFGAVPGVFIHAQGIQNMIDEL